MTQIRAPTRRELAMGLGAQMCATVCTRAAEPTTLAGHLTQLTRPGAADNRATYLPDGSALLFASMRTGKSHIWTMEPDGRNPRLLLKSGGNDYGRVAPSPDGSSLAFSSDRSGENVVYVLDVSRGTIVPVSDQSSWSFGPTWSLRNRIAYFSRRGGNRLNLWTVSSDGSNPLQITDRPGESRQPWWSPDGTTLAFSADDGTGRFQVWLASANGADARPLTAAGDWQQPFWSPDGRRIAASARIRQGGYQIVLIDANGSNVERIGQPADNNVHPAWSPDGRSIVFTAGQGARSALWRFDFRA